MRTSRTRAETRANYLLMFADMWGQKRPFHLDTIVEQYHVSKHIGAILSNMGLIKKAYKHGYYLWISEQPTSLNVTDALNFMKRSRQQPTQAVADFGKSLTEAYPKKGEFEKTIDFIVDNSTIEKREQAAINILGTIMRDNQHITYDLIRIERKEVKTDLLAR